jgi:hypothetical protein
MKIGLTEARIQVSADTPTFYPLLFLSLSLSLRIHRALGLFLLLSRVPLSHSPRE